MTLDQVIAGITPADTAAMERAKARWDSIAKPLGSLGALEEAVIRIAGMTGSADVDISKRAVVVMCADNGVVAQGVTQTGQEVTAIVAENMSTGDTSVCAMARSAGAEVVPVDIGTAVPLTGARIVQRCVRRGTADMTQGPAMSREEAVQAVLTGVEIARELCAGGVRLLATGEMGIGNTTTSSAVAAVLLGQEPVVMTGRGAGLSDAGLQKKIRAIETAVAVNRPDPADVLDVLHKVGGLDIAGLAGVFLGGALCHTPVLVDGFISSVAALGPPGCARPVRTTCWAPTRRRSRPAGWCSLNWACAPSSTPGCVWARALGPRPSCPCWIWGWRSTGRWPPLRTPTSRPTSP